MYTFASFAGEGVVVVTRGSIAADQTQFFLLSGHGTFLLLGIGEAVDRVTAAIDAARWRQILPTCKRFQMGRTELNQDVGQTRKLKKHVEILRILARHTHTKKTMQKDRGQIKGKLVSF